MSLSDKVFQIAEPRTHTGRRRQASKPMLERQRRARINTSLDELKNLVLSSLYRDSDQYSQKMEKAEILELAVNFLKMSQRRQNSGSLAKYRAGYNDCIARIFNHLENDPGISGKLREKVLSRLASFCYVAPKIECGSAAFCPSCMTKGSVTDGFSASVPPYTADPAMASPYDDQIMPATSKTSYEYRYVMRHCLDGSEKAVTDSTNANKLWRPWLSQPKAEDKQGN